MRITIDRLGHLGDGIGQGPDGPVFVPQMLPGEEVEGTVQGDRLTGARIVTPSPDRVRAPCPHYRTCGGCALQHATDAFVADWKQGVVRTALVQQGLTADLRPIVTSPARSRRRATFAGRRTKGGVLVGFHARGADTLIAVPGCILVTPALQAALPEIEALVRAGASRKGELALTVTDTLTGPDVAVTGGKPLDGPMRLDLARLAETHGLARLTWDDEMVALRVPPQVAFGRARVTLPPGAFLQATAEGEGALRAAVLSALGLDDDARPARLRAVADLFAGCGTFALPLAERVEVHAVEGDAALVAALDKGWRQSEGLKRVTTEVRDLFRRPLEPDELRRFDAVVIDPPRAGAEAQTATLARSDVDVIAMVSCNPVTFARDARTLVAAGYRIDWVQVVDQFRWSPHVECVGRFVRDRG